MKYGIHSLVFKQSLIILIGFTVVFGVFFGVTKYQAGKRISQLLMDRGTQVSERNVGKIDNIFSDAELIGQNVLERLGEERPDADALPEMLKGLLKVAHEKVPETVALVLATEEGVSGEYMRLAQVSGDSVKIIEGSGYSDKPWFVRTKQAGKPMWHEPFIGDFVSEPIAIYTVPYYVPDSTGAKVFGGVIAVDISLAFLQETVSGINVENHGYVFMLSAENTVVAHPNKDWIFKESLGSLIEKGHENIREFQAAIKENESGVIIGTSVSGSEACMYYTPMRVKGWTFGIIWPADQFFARQRSMASFFGWMTLGGYLFMFVLVVVVSVRIARPLNRMSRIAHELGKGDFSVKIPSIRGKDEMAQFAQAFNKMRESLIEYIENLKHVTDKNLRMESELNIARDIQLGVLPKDEDEESMRDSRHELSALLEPAREVGGDFYDFYALDKDHIVLLIADVSGKGVPAALFMMSVRTQLKTLALSGLPLDEVFNKANERLCHKNDSNMFVTVWMGILDVRTGRIEFCSGGHNPPVVIHADGTANFVSMKPGFVMAGMPGIKYELQTLDLGKGDSLFLYTDGVTESCDVKNFFFGDRRLLSVLSSANGVANDRLCAFMKSHIDEFVGDAPQFDDITMLALKYNGSEKDVET